jgi:hypothetical protein
VGIFGRRR